MARANKYASVNFNHVYEKSVTHNSNSPNNPSKNPNSPSSSSSSSGSYSTISSPNAYKNHISSSWTHGRMLVLTRPTPKPVPSIVTPPLSHSPQTTSTHQSQIHISDHPRAEPESVPDSISLRPLGRTGGGGSVSSPVLLPEREKELGPSAGSPKPDKFVPPHLRPGFVGREERLLPPPVFRGKEPPSQRQPPNQHRYGEEGRPKSGDYDRKGRIGEMDHGFVNRPTSSGNRPVSRDDLVSDEAEDVSEDK